MLGHLVSTAAGSTREGETRAAPHHWMRRLLEAFRPRRARRRGV